MSLFVPFFESDSKKRRLGAERTEFPTRGTADSFGAPTGPKERKFIWGDEPRPRNRSIRSLRARPARIQRFPSPLAERRRSGFGSPFGRTDSPALRGIVFGTAFRLCGSPEGLPTADAGKGSRFGSGIRPTRMSGFGFRDRLKPDAERRPLGAFGSKRRIESLPPASDAFLGRGS